MIFKRASMCCVPGSQTTKNFVPVYHNNINICKINIRESTFQIFTTYVCKIPFQVKCKNKRFIQHKLSLDQQRETSNQAFKFANFPIIHSQGLNLSLKVITLDHLNILELNPTSSDINVHL